MKRIAKIAVDKVEPLKLWEGIKERRPGDIGLNTIFSCDCRGFKAKEGSRLGDRCSETTEGVRDSAITVNRDMTHSNTDYRRDVMVEAFR